MPAFFRANGTTTSTIHIGVPSFPVALPLMRSNKPENPDSATVAAILEAGEQLLAALREEDRISKAYPKGSVANSRWLMKR